MHSIQVFSVTWVYKKRSAGIILKTSYVYLLSQWNIYWMLSRVRCSIKHREYKDESDSVSKLEE